MHGRQWLQLQQLAVLLQVGWVVVVVEEEERLRVAAAVAGVRAAWDLPTPAWCVTGGRRNW